MLVITQGYSAQIFIEFNFLSGEKLLVKTRLILFTTCDILQIQLGLNIILLHIKSMWIDISEDLQFVASIWIDISEAILELS